MVKIEPNLYNRIAKYRKKHNLTWNELLKALLMRFQDEIEEEKIAS